MEARKNTTGRIRAKWLPNSLSSWADPDSLTRGPSPALRRVGREAARVFIGEVGGRVRMTRGRRDAGLAIGQQHPARKELVLVLPPAGREVVGKVPEPGVGIQEPLFVEPAREQGDPALEIKIDRDPRRARIPVVTVGVLERVPVASPGHEAAWPVGNAPGFRFEVVLVIDVNRIAVGLLPGELAMTHLDGNGGRAHQDGEKNMTTPRAEVRLASELMAGRNGLGSLSWRWMIHGAGAISPL